MLECGHLQSLVCAAARVCRRLNGEIALVEVANDFCEVWLKDNYIGLLQDVMATAQGCRCRSNSKWWQFARSCRSTRASEAVLGQEPGRKAKSAERQARAATQEYAFNPKNTFETFVVGNNNNFAYAAAMAVAQSPGKSYNPLFLYGGVGLGKTHLLHAIGQHVVQQQEGRARRLRLLGEIHQRIH